MDTRVAFLKHLRCLLAPGSSDWDQNEGGPLCMPHQEDFAKHTAGGVSTCSAPQ
jgi:hypothetical protein